MEEKSEMLKLRDEINDIRKSIGTFFNSFRMWVTYAAYYDFRGRNGKLFRSGISDLQMKVHEVSIETKQTPHMFDD